MARDLPPPVLITMEHSMTGRGLHELSDRRWLLPAFNISLNSSLLDRSAGRTRGRHQAKPSYTQTRSVLSPRGLKHIYISDFHGMQPAILLLRPPV